VAKIALKKKTKMLMVRAHQTRPINPKLVVQRNLLATSAGRRKARKIKTGRL